MHICISPVLNDRVAACKLLNFYKIAVVTFKVINHQVPVYLSELITINLNSLL